MRPSTTNELTDFVVPVTSPTRTGRHATREPNGLAAREHCLASLLYVRTLTTRLVLTLSMHARKANTLPPMVCKYVEWYRSSVVVDHGVGLGDLQKVSPSISG